MTPEELAFGKALKKTWDDLRKALELCPPGYGIKEYKLRPALVNIDEALAWFEQSHDWGR